MNRFLSLLLAVIFGIALSNTTVAQDINILRTFRGGSFYEEGLLYAGGKLYGSDANENVLYSMNLDGSNYQIVHAFQQTHGMGPTGRLASIGSTLYGTTCSGGGNDKGTIYSVNLGGTDLHVLYNTPPTQYFELGQGLDTDGQYLYGYTNLSGGVTIGLPKAFVTAFRMDPSLGGMQDLGNRMSVGVPIGAPLPQASISFGGSSLYYTTSGDVYQLNKDGSNMHQMGLISEISSLSGLTVVGSKIYGLAENCIFSMNADGTDQQILHRFTDGYGCNRMTLVDSTLYGSTGYGDNAANIFSIKTDGSEYQVLHSFSGEIYGDLSELTIVDSTIYATSTGQGSHPGVVFSLPIPEPATFALLSIAAVGILAVAWKRRRRG